MRSPPPPPLTPPLDLFFWQPPTASRLDAHLVFFFYNHLSPCRRWTPPILKPPGGSSHQKSQRLLSWSRQVVLPCWPMPRETGRLHARCMGGPLMATGAAGVHVPCVGWVGAASRRGLPSSDWTPSSSTSLPQSENQRSPGENRVKGLAGQVFLVTRLESVAVCVQVVLA